MTILSKISFNLFESLGYNQLVDCATHIAGNILDLVFIRDSKMVESTKVYSEKTDVRISDHYMIEISLYPKFQRCHEVTEIVRRDISSIDQEAFSADLTSCMVSYKTRDDPQLNIDKFFDTINTVLDKHAPKVTKTIRKSSKLLSDENIKNSRKKKRRAERKFKRTGLERDKLEYKTASKDLVRTIQNCHNKYYSNKLSKAKNNPRETYSH